MIKAVFGTCGVKPVSVRQRRSYFKVAIAFQNAILLSRLRRLLTLNVSILIEVSRDPSSSSEEESSVFGLESVLVTHAPFTFTSTVRFRIKISLRSNCFSSISFRWVFRHSFSLLAWTGDNSGLTKICLLKSFQRKADFSTRSLLMGFLGVSEGCV